jgi:hypothetical protein
MALTLTLFSVGLVEVDPNQSPVSKLGITYFFKPCCFPDLKAAFQFIAGAIKNTASDFVYCYQLVNGISLGLAQSDPIKRRLLK